MLLLLSLLPTLIGASFIFSTDEDALADDVLDVPADDAEDTESVTEADNVESSIGYTFQDQAINEDKSISITPEHIESLVKGVQNGGEVPEFLLQNGSTLTIEVDGEIDGYLHLAEYTEAVQYTGYEFATDHVALIWSTTSEMPELESDYFKNDEEITSDDLVGSAGTVIMDLSVYSYFTALNGEISYRVTEAGHFEIDQTQIETSNTDLVEHNFEAENQYVNVGEAIVNIDGPGSHQTTSGSSISNGQHLELSFAQSPLEFSKGVVPTYDLTSDYSSTSNFANISVTIDTGPENYLHEIRYTNDSENMVMLVATSSLETPEFESDWFGNVYFSDSLAQPIAAFIVSDTTLSFNEGKILIDTSRA